MEGYPDVAGLFRDTADGETGHAHGHLDYLKQVGDPATGLPIGDTELNLKAAVAGETHEYTDMYPGMAKSAREEGFDDIAEWFETLAKAEKSHAGRFQKALDTLGWLPCRPPQKSDPSLRRSSTSAITRRSATDPRARHQRARHSPFGARPQRHPARSRTARR